MRFGQREVANVTFYNLATSKPDLYLDSLKMSSVGSDAQITWGIGGQGAPRLVGWESQRTVSFKAQDALATMESLAMLSGSAVTIGTGTANVMYKRETLLVVADTGFNKVTLTQTPITPSVSNTFVFKASSITDSENGTEILWETGGGVPTASHFTTTSTTVKVLAAECAAGTYITVYYTYSDALATTKRLAFKSDTFGGYYKIVGDTLVKSEAGTNYPFQIVIPKAKIISKWNFDLKPDGDSVVFDFEFEAAKDLTTDEMVYFVGQFA